jgi:acetyl esterase/lipase
MKIRLQLALPLFILLVIPACLRAQKEKEAPDVQAQKGIVYGKGGTTELMLNLAMPKEGEGPFPAIVCIHGGGWRGGKRESLDDVTHLFARKGYVAVTVSYRLVPDAKFPAQIEDCKAAVRWLRANAKKYKADPERIGAVGFSAGGHLCCLLGVTDKKDGLEGEGGNPDQSSRVQAVVSYFGPTDLCEKTWGKDLEEKVLAPFVGAAFDDKPELYKKVSPVTYVGKGAPPFLFFHGSKDTLVAPRHSKVMCEKLQAAGGTAKLVIMEGEGHGWAGDKLKQTVDQTVAFFDENLKKK